MSTGTLITSSKLIMVQAVHEWWYFIHARSPALAHNKGCFNLWSTTWHHRTEIDEQRIKMRGQNGITWVCLLTQRQSTYLNRCSSRPCACQRTAELLDSSRCCLMNRDRTSAPVRRFTWLMRDWHMASSWRWASSDDSAKRKAERLGAKFKKKHASLFITFTVITFENVCLLSIIFPSQFIEIIIIIIFLKNQVFTYISLYTCLKALYKYYYRCL